MPKDGTSAPPVGYATTELEGGDEAYLRDVGKRVDRLVLGMS